MKKILGYIYILGHTLMRQRVHPVDIVCRRGRRLKPTWLLSLLLYYQQIIQ